MNKIFFLILTVGICASGSQALAQSSAPAPHKAKAAKKTPAKNAPADSAHVPDAEDLAETDVHGSAVSEFQCELGNKITVYRNVEDGKHIALRWLKRIHRLVRVSTTTGADRFENRKAGLVWIGIPAKSMLLDSKKGQQLANECRTAEQMVPKEELKLTAPEPSKS